MATPPADAVVVEWAPSPDVSRTMAIVAEDLDATRWARSGHFGVVRCCCCCRGRSHLAVFPRRGGWWSHPRLGVLRHRRGGRGGRSLLDLGWWMGPRLVHGLGPHLSRRRPLLVQG